MLFESPLELLHVDHDLVDAAGGDPELVRTMAKGMFRTIARTLHTDNPGVERTRIFEDAAEAIAEINGADEEGMRDIIEEFQAGDPGERKRKEVHKLKDELEAEKSRRVAEARALLRCALAEQPSFSNALIEVGISPFYGTNEAYSPELQEEMSQGAAYQNPPLFVLINQDLKGHSLRAGNEPGGFVFQDEHIFIEEDGSARVKGSHTENFTGRHLTAELSLTPNREWQQSDNVRILGVVDRHIVEPDETLNYVKNLIGLPRAPKSKPAFTGTESLEWEDVSRPLWLQFIEPATPDNMTDRYVIVADKDLNEIAVLGLCRKLIL